MSESDDDRCRKCGGPMELYGPGGKPPARRCPRCLAALKAKIREAIPPRALVDLATMQHDARELERTAAESLPDSQTPSLRKLVGGLTGMMLGRVGGMQLLTEYAYSVERPADPVAEWWVRAWRLAHAKYKRDVSSGKLGQKVPRDLLRRRWYCAARVMRAERRARGRS